eukprot:XP_002531842.2 uncharacterized protein LOC8271718 isoform X1 [Ricinus communis]
MSKMRVAVIGGGISGLASAYVLAKAGAEVVVYEKEDCLGGHANKTVNYKGVDVDLGFLAFNPASYPNMEFFESIGVDMELSDMSFSVSIDKGKGYEWGSRKGLSSLFAQKKNSFNPYFWQMLRDINKFKHDALSYLEQIENNTDINENERLGQFIDSRGYSEVFQKAYLLPICRSIWSCPLEGIMNFSAFAVLSFFHKHHLLQIFGCSNWLIVKRQSQHFINKVRELLESWGCQIRTGCKVNFVSTSDKGCLVSCGNVSEEMYNGCIINVHAPNSLKLLGKQATFDERRILGAFQYECSDIVLHHDKSYMPKNPAAWCAWNFLGSTDTKGCLTYWLNVLENVGKISSPLFLTMNPDHELKNTLLKWSTSHPILSIASSKAFLEFDSIQGKRGIWFCEPYQGFGCYGDGLKDGMVAAHNLLGDSCATLSKLKHMLPSLLEFGARYFVIRLLGHIISTGSIVLLEDGGTIFTIEGASKNCSLKTILKVHNFQFYWKIMTRAEIGLAEAYINGDFSFIDKEEGLLNLFMIFVANRDATNPVSKFWEKRGRWIPFLLTACIPSAIYFFGHILRQNTLVQAPRNISHHYNVSNEFFAMFLDETMTYSCAVFKTQDEDLKVAQLRKISLLIEKARIDKKHEVLEIGCGWGSLAIEVVKKTGCKYTGITLSEEQLKIAEDKVKQAGLQDNIKFLLCDYRELPESYKYDRIISCGMIEHVGHEYMEEFFDCCESVLAEDGLLVLQFIAIPDKRYDEVRKSIDFLKEYIFPGGCLPSLYRITSAMRTASRLCMEHVENIGSNYYLTLKCWRKNFLKNKEKILAMGFDEKFIRTWEYYFDYCAAGFKSYTLLDYQIVFSRPGNIAALGNPYKGFPSAYNRE